MNQRTLFKIYAFIALVTLGCTTRSMLFGALQSISSTGLLEQTLSAMQRNLFPQFINSKKPLLTFDYRCEQAPLELAVRNHKRVAKKISDLSLEFAYDRVKLPNVSSMSVKINDAVTQSTNECTFEYKQYQQEALPAISIAYLSKNPRDLVYDKIRAEAIRRP